MAEKKETPKETIIVEDEDAIEHGEIHVRAVPEKGFRRAGIFFPREEVVIPADCLSKARYDAIKNEPMLVTVEIKAPARKTAAELKAEETAAKAAAQKAKDDAETVAKLNATKK